MPTSPRPPAWDAKQAAAVAELSEAHAYAAMARAATGQAGAPAVTIAPLGGGISLRCLGDPESTLFNRVLGLGIEQPLDAGVVSAVAARYGHLEGPWGMELAPAAMHEHARPLLRQLRLRRSLPTAMLVMNSDDLAGERPPWQVERVGAEQAALAADVVEQVFDVSTPVARILRCAPTSKEFAQWVAFDDGRPVACCLMHLRGETAWFGWSATLPTHRGRGLQSALLWHSVRDARERGCRWITAETATGTGGAPDPSFRNMKRFGFVELYRRHGYLHLPLRRVAGPGAPAPAPWPRSRF